MDFLNALPTVLANIVQDYDKNEEEFDLVIFELMSNEHFYKMREHLDENKHAKYKWTLGTFYDSLDGEERDPFEFIW